MGDMMSVLGERLKKLRKESGLTLDQLSSQLGIARTTLSGYESGRREPNMETILRIADLFNVSIDWLFGRTNSKGEAFLMNEKDTVMSEEDKKEVTEMLKKILDEQDKILGMHRSAKDVMEERLKLNETMLNSTASRISEAVFENVDIKLGGWIQRIERDIKDIREMITRLENKQDKMVEVLIQLVRDVITQKQSNED